MLFGGDIKMQDWNLADQIEGLENAGPESTLRDYCLYKKTETLYVINKHYYFM